MRIRFLGAAGTVTGSSFLIETGFARVMVDCGMFQGSRVLRERNYQKFSVDPASVDYILLTHAHIDHSGLIPKFIKNGFNGKVFATSATVDLCAVMLPDSGYIQEMEVERLNRKNRRADRPLVLPIYTADEARDSLRKFHRVSYGETFSLTPEIQVRFINAGHILGSSILEIWVREGTKQTKLVFSGDLGSRGKPFVEDPSMVAEADYVIMESTYGSRQHADTSNKMEMFHQVIWETYRKGGNLIIPAFAVERTQDLLYDINQLVTEGRFPPMDVYIDSPMAIAATEVFKMHQECFDDEAKKIMCRSGNPFDMPNLRYSRTTEESVALNNLKGGAVILSASGMCDAGRIKHHLRHNLWRPESTILFVGYQAPGTKGSQIVEGAKFIRIHGEDVKVRADIRRIDGYSAHADQKDLLDWLGGFTPGPGNVFLVHGEPEAAGTLAGLIKERFGVVPAIPQWLETFEITPGIVFSDEQVLQTHAGVAAKLQKLMEKGHGQGDYSTIMRQLNDLNGLLEKMSINDRANTE
ncbi:MAG: MBL fold metallo-hydrolase RNA specificity domain-containing protein [Desulfocucumaceae bacterium]